MFPFHTFPKEKRWERVEYSLKAVFHAPCSGKLGMGRNEWEQVGTGDYRTAADAAAVVQDGQRGSPLLQRSEAFKEVTA